MKKLLLFLFLASSDLAGAQIKGIQSYDNAYRNFTAGNFQEAIKNYNEYLKSYTNDDKAYFERGMCYESIGKPDDALRDYSTALNISPYKSKYLSARGYTYLKTGIPLNAYNDFTNAIQYSPNDDKAYYGRMNANLDLQNLNKALTDINAAINLDPTNPLYYYPRAIIYAYQNDTANFYNDLEKLIYQYPSSFFASYRSQTVVLLLDNVQNNIDNLTDMLRIANDDYMLYFRRAFNYYLYRKYTNALEDLTNAVKYCPDTNSRLIILAKALADNCVKFREEQK